MGALEQITDYLCPWMGQKVQIRIVYDCSNTRVCQINIEPAFYDCLLSDNCAGYKAKDKRCLLFQFHEQMIIGSGKSDNPS